MRVHGNKVLRRRDGVCKLKKYSDKNTKDLLKEDFQNICGYCGKDSRVMHENFHIIDPATDEYDQHIERDERGYIQGKTILGKNVCENLNFHIRRTDLYWKIYHLYKIQEQLEYLYDEKKLDEAEKNYYIESNKLLKQYIDEAFAKGE